MRAWISKVKAGMLCVLSVFGAVLLAIYGLGVKGGDPQFMHGIEASDASKAASYLFIGAGFYVLLLCFGAWQYYLNKAEPQRVHFTMSEEAVLYTQLEPKMAGGYGSSTSNTKLYE